MIELLVLALVFAVWYSFTRTTISAIEDRRVIDLVYELKINFACGILMAYSVVGLFLLFGVLKP